jgi:glycosylphosphatidylinositol transamidase (GPIT) subunit GPI8
LAQADLTKKELNEALKAMQEKKIFKELVYFVSTCHSGSMFNGTLEEDGPSGH